MYIIKVWNEKIDYIIKDFIRYVEIIESKYDPNQPRVPAGNPTGGEWTDDPRWTGIPRNDFEDYNVVIGNDLPEANILIERGFERDGTAREAKIFKHVSSVPNERSEKVKKVNIHIGGADDDINGNVRNSRTANIDTVGENIYATYNMRDQIEDYLVEVPDDYEKIIEGHSLGAATAAEIVEKMPEGTVDKLVTVDPVSTIYRPDYRKN